MSRQRTLKERGSVTVSGIAYVAFVISIPTLLIYLAVFVPSYAEKHGRRIGAAAGAPIICKEHGGVRSLDTGQYASDSVTCMDGTVWDAYSVHKCDGKPAGIGKQRCLDD